MDKLNETISSFTGGGGNNADQQQGSEQKQQGGGFLGGLGDKINSAAGGGRESEKNEDMLDKGTIASHRLRAMSLTGAVMQASISSKRESSARARRTTRVRSSRPRTSRSQTSFETNTSLPLVATFLSRTRTRNSVEMPVT